MPNIEIRMQTVALVALLLLLAVAAPFLTALIPDSEPVTAMAAQDAPQEIIFTLADHHPAAHALHPTHRARQHILARCAGPDQEPAGFPESHTPAPYQHRRSAGQHRHRGQSERARRTGLGIACAGRSYPGRNLVGSGSQPGYPLAAGALEWTDRLGLCALDSAGGRRCGHAASEQ